MTHIYDKVYQDRRKRRFNCICGGKYTLSHRARHKRSKIHQVYLEEQREKHLLEKDETKKGHRERISLRKI